MVNELGLNEEETEKFLENVKKTSFLIYAYTEVKEIVAEELLDLLYDQYPFFWDETRPEVLEMIEGIVSHTGYHLMMQFNKLVEDQKAGINIREVYPEFDQWKERHERLKLPKQYDDPEVNRYPSVYSDEEWRQNVLEEIREDQRFDKWESWRKFHYIDVIQRIILDAYEEIYDLNPDEWLIYEMTMDDEYDDYKSTCEDLELLIDMGLDISDFDHLLERYDALSKEEKDRVCNLHSSRIEKMIAEDEQLPEYQNFKLG